MKRVLLLILIVASPIWADDRPRVGLALGGGSARGIAHIGVLEWLEDNQIPVDFVAGTSMGGLVGGTFATGMSGTEIRGFLGGLDWGVIFLGETPYRLKSFRRKEDRRQFPVKLELGLRGGIKLPSGLDPAHQVGLLLSRIALPYSTLTSFDELPTPFRCVATDVERSEVVVLENGSLSQALLATMAIPGVFPSVVRGERVLADGGLLDNVPADVIPRGRVDVTIAVDVGNSTAAEGESSALTAAGQAIDVMMAAGTRRSLESADIVITPDVRAIGAFEWRRIDEIADIGRRAAEKHRGALEAYQLDDDAWAKYLERRREKTRTYDRAPEFITVSGVDDEQKARIEKRLERFVGIPLPLEDWHKELTTATGTGRYESLRYEEAIEGSARGLVVPTKEKSYAPPFARFNAGSTSLRSCT